MNNSKKSVISLFGYSCTGKSTAAEALKTNYQGLYTVDFDRLKRQLAGYHRDADSQFVRDIGLGFFEVICKTGKPVLLLMPPFRDQDEYKSYKEIANRYEYSFFPFEFTASREVLGERYRTRIESLEKAGNKITIRNEEEFLDMLNEPYFLPEDCTVFDSTNMKPEEIADQILEKIK